MQTVIKSMQGLATAEESDNPGQEQQHGQPTSGVGGRVGEEESTGGEEESTGGEEESTGGEEECTGGRDEESTGGEEESTGGKEESTGGEEESTGGEEESTGDGWQLSLSIGSESGSGALSQYRFLLLLHCYFEVASSDWMPSLCVMYVLRRAAGIHLCDFHGLSHSDLGVVSKVMEYHGDMVEHVDMDPQLGGTAVNADDLHQLMPGLLCCTRLKELRLSGSFNETHMAGLGEV